MRVRDIAREKAVKNNYTKFNELLLPWQQRRLLVQNCVLCREISNCLPARLFDSRINGGNFYAVGIHVLGIHDQKTKLDRRTIGNRHGYLRWLVSQPLATRHVFKGNCPSLTSTA